MRAKKQRARLLFLALVMPVLLLRTLTGLCPMLHAAYLSTTNLHLIDGTNSYVGMGNYRQLLHDVDFQHALAFTLIFIFFSTLLELVIGLLVALFLNTRFRLRLAARTINLIPWAIPTIVIAYTFQWMLDDQFGILAHWAEALTGHRPALLNSPLGAQISLILVNVWKNAPFMAIVFLAGLQGIPQEPYEAAKVDGAGAWQRFSHITIPMMTPLAITMGMYFVIWQMASFDLIFGLTRGGPGTTTTVLSLKIFQEGLVFFKFGYASAISVVLMVLVASIGVIGVVWFRRSTSWQ